MFYPSILAFIITGCCSCIFGMDPATIPDNRTITWKIILQHGVQWFDYRKIQSLVVSKTHDKLLRDTAQYRKEYLVKQLDLKADNLVWDKYGAMSASVTVEFNVLSTRRYYLHPYGWQNQPGSVCYGSHQIALPYQPYFNNRGTFCFYVYSTSYSNYSYDKNGTILKQMRRSSKRTLALGLGTEECMTNAGGKKIKLAVFLEFPVLLKAFLKSKKIYKEKAEWRDDKRIYALEGVTIPKNYRKHQQYFSTVVYPSFDYLPKKMRQAIVNRYKMQEKKS